MSAVAVASFAVSIWVFGIFATYYGFLRGSISVMVRGKAASNFILVPVILAWPVVHLLLLVFGDPIDRDAAD